MTGRIEGKETSGSLWTSSWWEPAPQVPSVGRTVCFRCASARHRSGAPTMHQRSQPEHLVLTSAGRSTTTNPSRRLHGEQSPLNVAPGHVDGRRQGSITTPWYGRVACSETTTGGDKWCKGWAFADVLPTFKAQENWEGGAILARSEWPHTHPSPQGSSSDGTRFSRGCSPEACHSG